MLVRFLESMSSSVWGSRSRGEVAEVPDGEAQLLIAAGRLESVDKATATAEQEHEEAMATAEQEHEQEHEEEGEAGEMEKAVGGPGEKAAVDKPKGRGGKKK